nr:hypothetical protein [Agrobacterium tumefaciens]
MHIWEWFVELHNSRQSGFAANPIAYQEIESFCRMTGAIISPWELSVIRRMDQAVLAVFNKSGRKPEKEPTDSDAAATKQSIRGAMKHRRVVKVARDQ